MKKIVSLLLVLSMLFVTAFAAGDTQTADSSGSQMTIPVKITAEATRMDVTVPTTFPTTGDSDGGVTTSDQTIITNSSYGAIVVSNITVKDNNSAEEGQPSNATWHLTAYDKDMSKVPVDSKIVGIAVAPKGGRTNATGDISTGLKTTEGEGKSETQVLLDTVQEQWVVEGKSDTSETDTLQIVYDANFSPVSEAVTNEPVANIIVTISWYTGG